MVVAWRRERRRKKGRGRELCRAREELRRSEARFRAATAAMQDAFYIAEGVRDEAGKIVDFRFVEMNDAAALRLGRPRSEILGRLQSDLVGPTGRLGLFAQFVRVVEDREPQERELELDEPGIAVRWIRIHIVPLGDGVALTSRDIGLDRRHREILELHSAIVRSMGEGVSVARSSDRTIVYVNPKFEAMFGYARGELDGRPVAIILPPDAEQEEQTHAVRARLRTTNEVTFERRYVKKDGSDLWCRATVCAVDHPEHGASWVTTLEDVTERRRTAAMVAHLAAIVDSSQEPILGKTAGGIIESWNLGATRLYGYRPEEAIGKHVSLVIPPELLEEDRLVLDRIRRGEPVAPFETTRIHKDGTRLLVVLTASAVYDARGEVAGVSTITHDITERKRAEHALEASLREKEILLKEIHHRVKNNLQVVSSLLKLQAQQMTEPAARAAFQDSQERVRAIALLHEKLYESKDLGSVDLAEYTRSLVAVLLRAQGGAAAQAAVKIDAEGIFLPLDLAAPCGLILNELLTNAFKHAFRATSARPEVRVVVRRRGPDLELTVADNGAGLPAGFDVAHSKTLGMHVVRTLARQLGGALHLTTEDGARCTLRFPEHPEKEI